MNVVMLPKLSLNERVTNFLSKTMNAFAVVVYFILSRLLYLAFPANLGLLSMLHPGMGPLV